MLRKGAKVPLARDCILLSYKDLKKSKSNIKVLLTMLRIHSDLKITVNTPNTHHMNKPILCLSKNILYEDKERERRKRHKRTNVCFTTEI